MAYGLKYELLCTTVKGNLYKVKISFDGYTGNPIDRNVPLSPFKLKKDKPIISEGPPLITQLEKKLILSSSNFTLIKLKL